MQADRVRPMIDEKLWKLWKEYRSGPSWQGEPKYFKSWVEARENHKRIDWDDKYRNGVLKQATLEIDGFRIVVGVEFDEDSRIDDGDSYGEYSDYREDHYAIDRLQGVETCIYSRDPRKRYYNEPKHSRYEQQRNGWLEVRKPETVALGGARGKKLAKPVGGYEAGTKVTEGVYASLLRQGFPTVPVEGRLLSRCRYNGVYTRAKHTDDVHVRENIVKQREIVDGWYDDSWHYVTVFATAYKGDVELGSASCGGIDDIDESYVDYQAWEIAEEAAHAAAKAFIEMRGTDETRCALIGEVFAAAEADGTDESLDAWLGFLYAKIATGAVLDLTDAPPDFNAFFDRHPDLKKRTRLYVNGLEDW